MNIEKYTNNLLSLNVYAEELTGLGYEKALVDEFS